RTSPCRDLPALARRTIGPSSRTRSARTLGPLRARAAPPGPPAPRRGVPAPFADVDTHPTRRPRSGRPRSAARSAGPRSIALAEGSRDGLAAPGAARTRRPPDAAPWPPDPGVVTGRPGRPTPAHRGHPRG